MEAHTVRLAVEAGVATIVLNRPEKRNAFTDGMRARFMAVLDRVSADRAVRAVAR